MLNLANLPHVPLFHGPEQTAEIMTLPAELFAVFRTKQILGK